VKAKDPQAIGERGSEPGRGPEQVPLPFGLPLCADDSPGCDIQRAGCVQPDIHPFGGRPLSLTGCRASPAEERGKLPGVRDADWGVIRFRQWELT